jgi:hypothetical protein
MLVAHMALGIVVMAVEMMTAQLVDEEHVVPGLWGGYWYALEQLEPSLLLQEALVPQ